MGSKYVERLRNRQEAAAYAIKNDYVRVNSSDKELSYVSQNLARRRMQTLRY